MFRRRSSAYFVGLILGLMLGISPSSAFAEEAADGPPPEAKKAFADGKAAFERGQYEVALQLFQRAVLIAPAPSLYYNIGMAYERLSRYEDSAIAFEKYLQLADAPQTDDEKTFQTNLRSRAAANRLRAKRAPSDPITSPPTSLVEPPPAPPPAPPPVDPRGAYVPQPYGAYAPPRYVYTAPPLTRVQKIEKARHYRNDGVALTIVGTVFTLAGAGATAWAATTDKFDGDNEGLFRGLAIWGATAPIIVGIPLLIPGAVSWSKWQRELDREGKRPDDGAAEKKAALDLAAPPVALSGGTNATFVSVPAFSF